MASVNGDKTEQVKYFVNPTAFKHFSFQGVLLTYGAFSMAN